MKKRYTQGKLYISLAMAFVIAIVSVAPVGAAIDPIATGCTGSGASSSPICTGGSATGGAGEIQNIINLLLYVLGIIAVIMIIVGGMMYATSGGDSGRVKTGKDTILYAVVGLIVAMLAYAIVNFVLGKF